MSIKDKNNFSGVLAYNNSRHAIHNLSCFSKKTVRENVIPFVISVAFLSGANRTNKLSLFESYEVPGFSLTFNALTSMLQIYPKLLSNHFSFTIKITFLSI